MKKYLKICKEFINSILKKEKWFSNMINNNDCDLILLAGSSVNNLEDLFSDVDIFLICKKESLIKYSLKPGQIYNFQDKEFDVSILSTERLYDDSHNKENIYRWYNTHIIKTYNKEVKKILCKASFLTKEEFLSRVWTNFCQFEVNSDSLKKQIKRKELLSVKILFNENIKLVIDSVLACEKKFPSWKQFGRVLSQENKKLYNKILKFQNLKNLNELQYYNTQLRLYMVKILKDNNFSDEEIKSWAEYNLIKNIFLTKN